MKAETARQQATSSQTNRQERNNQPAKAQSESDIASPEELPREAETAQASLSDTDSVSDNSELDEVPTASEQEEASDTDGDDSLLAAAGFAMEPPALQRPSNSNTPPQPEISITGLATNGSGQQAAQPLTDQIPGQQSAEAGAGGQAQPAGDTAAPASLSQAAGVATAANVPPSTEQTALPAGANGAGPAEASLSANMASKSEGTAASSQPSVPAALPQPPTGTAAATNSASNGAIDAAHRDLAANGNTPPATNGNNLNSQQSPTPPATASATQIASALDATVSVTATTVTQSPTNQASVQTVANGQGGNAALDAQIAPEGDGASQAGKSEAAAQTANSANAGANATAPALDKQPDPALGQKAPVPSDAVQTAPLDTAAAAKTAGQNVTPPAQPAAAAQPASATTTDVATGNADSLMANKLTEQQTAARVENSDAKAQAATDAAVASAAAKAASAASDADKTARSADTTSAQQTQMAATSEAGIQVSKIQGRSDANAQTGSNANAAAATNQQSANATNATNSDNQSGNQQNNGSAAEAGAAKAEENRNAARNAPKGDAFSKMMAEVDTKATLSSSSATTGLAASSQATTSTTVTLTGVNGMATTGQNAHQISLANSNAIAAEISKFAKKGETRLEIRLDPADMGKIDVRMTIGSDGHTRAHLYVERADTLDMLTRDQRFLERSLQQSGVNLQDQGLEYSLMDQGNQGWQMAGQDQSAQEQNYSSNDSSAEQEAETTAPAVQEARYASRYVASNGLNLVI
ncbi:flagellar hook-length control protein FliK [uncultured Cohaesibacter sp.]|uniref:flagellar hook-length control protein FliK n=1 Tax=uncultured Cohaesibacter sp. TaxID=1002546 RepID=UPI0029C7F8F3|nr:flagellar hook-length control protein FliK [uncultured Cohaesibacter sp.]